MTLGTIFTALAIILTLVFLVNHWKGIVKMLLVLLVAYLCIELVLGLVNGTLLGYLWIVQSIACAVGACIIFKLIKG